MTIEKIILNLLTNKKVLVFLLVLFLSITAFGYYKYTSWRIESLAASAASLEMKLKDSHQTIELMRRDVEMMVELRKKYESKLLVLEKDSRELKAKLYREEEKKKSIEELAAKHPKWIEKIINRSSASAARCLEIITGSPLTPADSNLDCGEVP